MNTNIIYFSATHTGKRSAIAVANGISDTYIEYDFTIKGSEKDLCFKENDLVIIAAPVYGGRIYKGAMDRFSRLKGDNTPCVIIAAYGNRHYDDSLLELKEFMLGKGFIPIGAAAVVCEHTFGSIQSGRPNVSDLKEDTNFGQNILEKINNEITIVKVPGNVPYKDGGKGADFLPSTLDNCVKCGECVKSCPEQAIDIDCKTIDQNKCISCFRCIKDCKFNAKACVSDEYINFVVGFNKMLEKPRQNEYFL